MQTQDSRLAKLNHDSVWLLIDVQTRLWPAMDTTLQAPVLKNIQRLVDGCKLLGHALWVSEQYPQGLGETLIELKTRLPEQTPLFAKTQFSAWHENVFQSHADAKKSQVVLFGLETHICVLQTALDARASGKTVFVVEDAVISRDIKHRDNALARMRDAGCVITNTESALFEPLLDAHHPQFKAISALIK
jgi:Isochorismatase family